MEENMKVNIEVALKALKWAAYRSRQQEERDYYDYAIQSLQELVAPSREQLIAEVTVLTEMVRVLSGKVEELQILNQPTWFIDSKHTTPQRTWVGLMRGVRVEGDTVVISVKGGNDEARCLCSELINEMEMRHGSD
jgi:hypothetical protein